MHEMSNPLEPDEFADMWKDWFWIQPQLKSKKKKSYFTLYPFIMWWNIWLVATAFDVKFFICSIEDIAVTWKGDFFYSSMFFSVIFVGAGCSLIRHWFGGWKLNFGREGSSFEIGFEWYVYYELSFPCREENYHFFLYLTSNKSLLTVSL